MTYEDVQKKLRREQVDDFDADYDKLPPDIGTFPEPPQPGPFRLKLPENLVPLWDVLEVHKYGEDNKPVMDAQGKPVMLQRVQISFDRDNPLTVVQSKAGRYDGEPVIYRVSNVERWRKLPGTKTRVKVNDMIYLVRVFDPAAAPKNNEQFMDALNRFGGREFGADAEWSGYCNPEKSAYFAIPILGADGKTPTGDYNFQTYTDPNATEPRVGCGERIYMDKWPKDEKGDYQSRAYCKKCNAALRPFLQLRGFRA